MKMLSFDTSNERLSVALFDSGGELGCLSADTGARHSTVLLPMIKEILKKYSAVMEDISVLAISLGPGSFTGLRVGLATAKMFGYVLKKKIVGVSSLEAMAIGAGLGKVAVMLDARRSEVYGAVYEHGKGGLKTILKPSLMTTAAFTKKTAGLRLVTAMESPPDASGVGKVALTFIAKKKFSDPFKLEPLYLRARDCNVTPPKK